MGSSTANQKLDEAGVVGLSLQKLLIFFMLLDAAWLVLGYSFFGPFMSFMFHFVVLMGIYRRRTSVLLIYAVFNMIFLALAAIAVLFLIGGMMSVDPDNYGSSSSSEYVSTYTTEFKGGLKSLMGRSLFSSNSTTTYPVHSSSESSNGSSSYNSSSDDGSLYTDLLIVSAIAMLLSFIVLYLKIYSVVLACRMRRILLATPALPVYSAVDDQPAGDNRPLLYNHEEAAAAASFDDANPLFTQPGFIPFQPQLFYPNVQGAPSMGPPPFMYGQQPVFYTFAPMPQPPANEKF